MRYPTVLLSLFILAGCIGNPQRKTEIAYYDLGNPGENSGTWVAPGFPIATIEVRTSTWLDSPAQIYRLVYIDALRRHTYAENRWIATPANLFEQFLQRRIIFGQPDYIGPGCRLSLTLDELEQRFDTPQTSKVVIEARATLLPLHGETILSKRAFSIQKPAPTADARGGVAATQLAADALAGELAEWLRRLTHERPLAITRCKEKT